MPFVGGTDLITVTLDEFGVDTLVTATIAAPPDGTDITPTFLSNVDKSVWTSTPQYDAAGQWIATITATGTGANVWAHEIHVSAIPEPAALATWRPELWHVAAYIPNRTIVGAVDGYGNPRRTFDPDTYPSNAEVSNLITDACGWVLTATGDLDESLGSSARGIAAKRAAGWAEWSYPDTDDDKRHAEALLGQADAELKALVDRNEALTGDDPSTSADDVLPDVWYPTVADTWSC